MSDEPSRSLANLQLPEYIDSRKSDVVAELYSPCLRNSVKYLRGAGYFRSSVYRLMTEDLLDFCIAGGHITLITSPYMTMDDYEAIMKGYDKNSFKVDLEDLLLNEKTIEPTKMLCALISGGHMDIRIALMREDLYHQKKGYFVDSYNNIVAFDGSGNETLSALKPYDAGNSESFNIGWNWDSEDWNRRPIRWYNAINETLDDNFDSTFPVIKIDELDSDFMMTHDIDIDLESHRKEAKKRVAKMKAKWDEIYGSNYDLVDINSHFNPISNKISPLPFPPREHQKIGLKVWKENKFRGILKHATGSGKTITSILAIDAHISEGMNAIVLVPSDPLLNQWDSVFGEYLPNVTRGLLGGGYNDSLILDEMTVSEGQGVVLISTIHSFRNEKILRKINRLLESEDQSLLLVVDECHRIGAPSFSEICTKTFSKVLGLSATPERQGDHEGTERIFNFLGSVIDEYTLKNAIDDGHLSKFKYHISTVNLTSKEQSEYEILRQKIRDALRMHKEGQPLGEYLEMLIFASRRIIRGAEEKIPETLRVLKKNFQVHHHWLIYCDTTEMMDDLSNQIYQNLNYRPLSYDSRLSSTQRKIILSHFEENGGIILAIKCLDEGVDIPSISHGIVLSSSKTKREWIQRRGRLLRKSSNKEYSEIFDVLALPDEAGDETSFVMDEVKRSYEFSESALNYRQISVEIDRLRRQYDIKLEDIIEESETNDEPDNSGELP
tara:strand:- start:439 stop:2607 length:2169 start_codon:yes stop_codon:yes gene_type:complete